MFSPEIDCMSYSPFLYNYGQAFEAECLHAYRDPVGSVGNLCMTSLDMQEVIFTSKVVKVQ